MRYFDKRYVKISCNSEWFCERNLKWDKPPKGRPPIQLGYSTWNFFANSENKPNEEEANKNSEHVQQRSAPEDDKKETEQSKTAVDSEEPVKSRNLEEPFKIEPIVETIVKPMIDPKDEEDSAGEFMHEEIEED